MAVHDLLERIEDGDMPFGVVASYGGESDSDDLDGARWKVLITDGETWGIVEVELSATDGGRSGLEIEPKEIERAAERIASRFPVGDRVASMVAWSEHTGPMPLHRDDLDAR